MSQERASCHPVEPTIGGWSYLSRERRPTPEEHAAAIKKGEKIRKSQGVGGQDVIVQPSANDKVNPNPVPRGDSGTPLSGISW